MPSSNNVRKVTSENYPTDAGHIGDDQHGEGGHNDGDDADEAKALGVKVVQLGVVACAVVVADDGGAADGIAHEDGHKQERRIHDASGALRFFFI